MTLRFINLIINKGIIYKARSITETKYISGGRKKEEHNIFDYKSICTCISHVIDTFSDSGNLKAVKCDINTIVLYIGFVIFSHLLSLGVLL